MNIKPIKNNIIFRFVDLVDGKGEFKKDATESGIILRGTFDESAKEPRWITVLATGPECKHVTTSKEALIPALRWTNSTKVGDLRIWKTDEREVVAVRDSATGELQAIGSYLVFKRLSATELSSSSGLIIVTGNSEDTPTGRVVSIGDDVDPILTNAKIYFDGTNFLDEFTHNGEKFAFIKQDAIAVYEPAE